MTRFVAGREATAAEVRSPRPAGRGWPPALRAVHAGPPLPVAFDVPALAAAYAAETVARGGVVPAAYAGGPGAGRPHRRRVRDRATRSTRPSRATTTC